MFQIVGAMAEFERPLIQERVRAGLRNARAKGRGLGRPRVIVEASRIALFRALGRSWAQIVAETGPRYGPAGPCRIAQNRRLKVLLGIPRFDPTGQLRWDLSESANHFS
jgi:hypothetical protein